MDKVYPLLLRNKMGLADFIHLTSTKLVGKDCLPISDK